MSALAIIIVVFVLLVVLLIVGGLIANGRRARGEEDELLVAAARGRPGPGRWPAPATAAGSAASWRPRRARRSPRARPSRSRELLLVQVVDRPGTEEDQALFRVVTDAGSEEILLVRDGAGGWHAAEPL